MRKPSVTELLDILAKPALLEWANKQGLAGRSMRDIRDAAKASGLSMHEQIETGQFSDPVFAEQHARFMRDKEVIDREQRIETEWFTGRYDARLRHKGLTYLVDYKKSDRRVVYFEHKLQLGAYAMAIEADRLGVVCLPDCALVEVDVDRKACAEMMIALARIYALRKEIE